jgi:hypothetical protein
LWARDSISPQLAAVFPSYPSKASELQASALENDCGDQSAEQRVTHDAAAEAFDRASQAIR